jgi:hypothetical protein
MTWTYEAPEVRKTFRAAASFWEQLDKVPTHEVGRFLGSVDAEAIIDYFEAVTKINPHRFATKWRREDKARHRLNQIEELAQNGETLTYQDDRVWKIKYSYLYGGEIHSQTLHDEHDSRTNALVAGMNHWGLKSRSRLLPFRCPASEPEAQDVYLLLKEIELAELRELVNILHGRPSDETLELAKAKEIENLQIRHQYFEDHPEQRWLLDLANALEDLK